jgi:hypothetical protein
MAYFKVRIDRASNTPKTIIVSAATSQQAIRVAASQLRSEGITDARAIEVIGRVKNLRD